MVRKVIPFATLLALPLHTTYDCFCYTNGTKRSSARPEKVFLFRGFANARFQAASQLLLLLTSHIAARQASLSPAASESQAEESERAIDIPWTAQCCIAPLDSPLERHTNESASPRVNAALVALRRGQTRTAGTHTMYMHHCQHTLCRMSQSRPALNNLFFKVCPQATRCVQGDATPCGAWYEGGPAGKLERHLDQHAERMMAMLALLFLFCTQLHFLMLQNFAKRAHSLTFEC